MKQILQTQIIPTGRVLMGRKGFFFEQDNGGNSGGAPSQGGGNSNPGGSGDSGGQQQQQQQQDAAPPDPFASIDVNLLDDASRQAIEKARGEITRLHGQAKQSSGFQSERDRLIAHQQKLEQALHSMQNKLPNQQEQQQRESTMEDDLIEEMMLHGMNQQQAAAAAKIQVGMLARFEKRFEQKLGSRLAPVVGQVFDQQAQSVFESAKNTDSVGAMDIPEVSQAVWQNITSLAQSGKIVTPEVAENLVSIYYMRHLRENGGSPNPRQDQQQQQQQQQNGNVNTRYTFPGAGIHARPPQQQQKADTQTPEEAAAMAATTAMWPVQPKQHQAANGTNGLYITRNGQRNSR